MHRIWPAGHRRILAAMAAMAVPAAMAAAALVSACAQVSAGSAPAAAAVELPQDRLAAITALIGQPVCQQSSDCRVVGLGASPCGGPEGYRAWSIRVSDGAKLAALVARDAALRRDELARQDAQGVCRHLPAPEVACVRAADGAPSLCRLVQPGRGS